MKKSLFLFLLVASVGLFGQAKPKVNRKTLLMQESISYAIIGKYLKKQQCISDSCWTMIYRNLSTEQTSDFIKQWNTASYTGEKRLKPRYCIYIYLKDGTKKEIKAGSTLNEINNYQFTIEDKHFLNKLWDNATKE